MTSPIPHTHVRRLSALEKRCAALTKNLARSQAERTGLQDEVKVLRAKINAFERSQLEAWERDLTDLLSDIRMHLDMNVRRMKRSA